jgi:tRNA-specific 2-thiouridylase
MMGREWQGHHPLFRPLRLQPVSSAVSDSRAESVAATPAVAASLERLRAWPGDHRVVVGLSGGVDSSLTAALLVQAGWQVEGLTLWLMSGKGACCAEGLVDAAAICEQLGVPHHVVDFREHFQRQIVDFLVEGYGRGVTPLPCSRCNREVKFGPMLAWSRSQRQIGRLATGHYARVRHAGGGESLPVPGDGRGRHQLLRGLDASKDQSYFLYDLPQEILGELVFPLGEMRKSETRLEAKRFGLRTANKPESQDLCLADHHGSMKAFLDAYLPPRQGEIVLQDGTVVGRHDGIEHFTIGQRRGLGVAWREPLHVVRLDAAFNRVVVASRQEAARSSCRVQAVNWVSMAPPDDPLEVQVQVRYRSEPETAWLYPNRTDSLDGEAGGSREVELQFAAPQFSITPGQAAVFYAGEVVLGGGLIAS